MDDFQNTTPDSELLTQASDIDSPGDDEVGEALSIKATRFLRLCWAKRGIVFGILAIGILISIVSALLQPNLYTSTTTLMPPNNTSPYSSIMNLLTSSSPAASFGGEEFGMNSSGELYVSILDSRNVLDSLIARFDLLHHYRAHLMADARKSLEGRTKVTQDRKSGIISISVTDVNPVLASSIAQGYVIELNRVVTDNSTSSARRERIFLEGRVKDVKQELDDSSKELSQFSTKSGAIDIVSQEKSMVEAGLRLQGELAGGRSQLAALRQTYSEDNPRVRAAEARNAELQRQMDQMGGRHQQPESNAEVSKSGYPSADELPALGLTYFDLERKMRVDEALWEALTKQYEVAKVEEAEQIPTLRVLDAANVPERKSGPSRRLIVLTGALLSFLAALIAVFALSFWKEMDPEDEPKKLIAEVVGAAADGRRWYWSLPGMRKIHRRLAG